MLLYYSLSLPSVSELHTSKECHHSLSTSQDRHDPGYIARKIDSKGQKYAHNGDDGKGGEEWEVASPTLELGPVAREEYCVHSGACPSP